MILMFLRTKIGWICLIGLVVAALAWGWAHDALGLTVALLAAPALVGLALYALAYVLLVWPRGRQTHRYDIVIAAAPETVWNTHLFHCGHCDYRPGMRILRCDILAQTPLIVRCEVQPDYELSSSSATFAYDIYEPYARYRLTHQADDDDAEGANELGRSSHDEAQTVEQGELEPVSVGTRLQMAITAPMNGLVLPWALRRRTEENLRALKDVCEGRKPKPPRGALPLERWELIPVRVIPWLSIAVFALWSWMALPKWMLVCVVAVLLAPCIPFRFLARFFALG
jgi:hypothetical protein